MMLFAGDWHLSIYKHMSSENISTELVGIFILIWPTTIFAHNFTGMFINEAHVWFMFILFDENLAVY